MPTQGSLRVDFYLLRDSRRSATQLCCQLCAKAFDEGQHISIVSQDDDQALALDALLWQMPITRFIPHGRSGEANAAHAPIVIGAADEQTQVLLNLSAAVPELTALPELRRILEIVSDDEPARNSARQRYRVYQQLGAQLYSHELNS